MDPLGWGLRCRSVLPARRADTASRAGWSSGSKASVGQVLVRRPVVRPDELQDGGGREHRRGGEVDHRPQRADVGGLDVEARGLERAKELFDDSASATEIELPRRGLYLRRTPSQYSPRVRCHAASAVFAKFRWSTAGAFSKAFSDTSST